MLYNKEQIMSFIPHREPFLFLDSIDAIEKECKPVVCGTISDNKEIVGLNVKATFLARKEHPIFAGHFPGNPILPGVVQIEMMAQAACFVAASKFSTPSGNNVEVALLSVDAARFRRPVVPDMILNIEAVCTKIRGTIMSFDAKISCDGNPISETKLLASLKVNH